VSFLFFELNEGDHVVFHQLVSVKDGERYIVGRPDTRTFVELPEVGVQTINLLQNGLSVKEVQEDLKKKLGKEFDVKSFVDELVSLGFIKKIEGQVVEEVHGKKREFLRNVKAEHVRFLFSKPLLWGFLAPIIMIGLSIMILNPYCWPKPQDFLFHERLSIVLLIGLGLGLALSSLHELAHLFSAKSLGVQGSISISNRLFYVVFETDLTNIWVVPRRRRFLVYAAGMIFDLFVISSLTILTWLYDIGVLGGGGILYKLAKATIYLEILKVLFQLMFFMRTDIYFLFADFFKCKNLYGDTVSYITNALSRLLRGRIRRRDMSFIPENEMKVIRKYSIFFLTGTLITIFLFVFQIVPLTVAILIFSAQILLNAGSMDTIIDSSVFISLIILYSVFLGYSLWKKRRERLRAAKDLGQAFSARRDFDSENKTTSIG